MPLTITVLLENKKINKNLIAKPGLSLLLQDECDKVLFDTGPDGSFLHNAQQMEVNLNNLTAAVLSHGHYDHCGGVPWLMKGTRIICHPGVSNKRYAAVHVMGREMKMKQLSADVELEHHNMEYTREPFSISKRFLWSGEVDVPKPEAYGLLEGEPCRPDYIDDEGVLIYRSEQGLIIITGCGHKGLINIIRHCQKITGDKRIYAIIGGFHLRYASPRRLIEVRRFLQQIKPRWVMGCHCTGGWGKLWLPDTTTLITGSRVVLT
jgi:7,8-dihydropterin-6-yl-methyl-4-(beta-D-ribofuranosyl)aminobenzene 5'-phosphate synthase